MLARFFPFLVWPVFACCLVPLTGCSNSPIGDQLKRSLAADPLLKSDSLRDTPLAQAGATASPSAPAGAPAAQLPSDFPADTPRYPNSQLSQVNQTPGSATGPDSSPSLVARWTTPDNSALVITFYRQALQTNNWQLIEQPQEAQQGNFLARRGDVTLTVAVQPIAALTSPTGTAPKTEYTLQVSQASNDRPPAASATPAASPSGGSLAAIAPFTAQTTVGVASAPSAAAATSSSSSLMTGASGTDSLTGSPALPPSPLQQVPTGVSSFTDLNQVPQELRAYVEDLARLGVLTAATDQRKATKSSQFEPNQPITRREYIRWLVATNNRLFANRPAQQVRSGLPTSQPAFRDVPATDPDFGAIQGLAEAGVLPSLLSGDSAAALFQPDQPLIRETLLSWKVPMDTRQPLPAATMEAIKQTWGFADTARIDPKALKAVLADFQNGDQSNIRRAFGFTTLFQPRKKVTRSEAAATLWHFGYQGEGQSAQDALKAGG